MSGGDEKRATGVVSKLVSRTCGGLSALNLIRDLDPVALRGLVEEWVLAYHDLVGRIAHLGFGWIDWRWVRLTVEEAHLVVSGSGRMGLDPAANEVRRELLGVVSVAGLAMIVNYVFM